MLIKRMTEHAANDLTTVYRPYKINEVIGQDINKNIIKNGLENGTTPHCMLFVGPAGCGKTTAARIIALGINCKNRNLSTIDPCLECESCLSIIQHSSMDVMEINVAKAGGKAAVDKITDDLSFAPFNCRNKVLIFDEAHELTKAAQALLLKEIEDGYSSVYFIFCTNKPEKLDPAFRSRVKISTLHFGRLSDQLMYDLLVNICDYEGIEYDIDIIGLLIEEVQGVPRDGIGILKSVIDEGSWNIDNIKVLLGELITEDNKSVIDMSRALLRGDFVAIVKLLTKLKNSPEDQIRISIAGFFTNKLKRLLPGREADNISTILDIMTVPIFMTGKPAHHILVNNLYKCTKAIRNR